MTRRILEGADGVRLGALEAGPPDGPLTILLHGFPEDAESWRPQVEALAAAGLRVLAPDQRGYGDDRPRGLAPYRVDRLAADVLALADRLAGERFHLVGHDWGGAVAWRVAEGHPERVARLAVLNGPHIEAMRGYLRRHPSQMRRSAYIAAFQPPWLAEALLSAGDFALLERTLRRSAAAGAFDAAAFARLKAGWRAPGALTARLNWYRALRLDPATPAVLVTPPTLILWGARDAFLERGVAEAALARCDRGRLEVLAHAGHWLHREAPAEVSARLAAFLLAPERQALTAPPGDGS